MTFHYYQIPAMIIVIWIGYFTLRVLYFVHKEKPKRAFRAAKQLTIPVIIGILLILFMPIKLTESNMSVHENVKFDIPPRVEVKQTDFNQDQRNQLKQLKEESKNALK